MGITIGSSHVVAQQAQIPSWVKNTALWWGQGQIGDKDFIKAIQWMVDNGVIHLSGQAQSQPDQAQLLTTQPAQKSSLFSPCSDMNLTGPSSCLSNYLPAPADVGSSWSSHNGISIPPGVSSPILAQMVREDLENVNTSPVEIFDVWIEEYQPPEKGQEIFKQDEKAMENGASKFFGDAQSNDTSFICICSDGAGVKSYNSEFVVGSVIVKVDGIGNAKNVITDMGSINKLVLEKMMKDQ